MTTSELLKAAAGITAGQCKVAISWPGAGSGFTPPPLVPTPTASAPKPPAPKPPAPAPSLLARAKSYVGSKLPAMPSPAQLAATGARNLANVGSVMGRGIANAAQPAIRGVNRAINTAYSDRGLVGNMARAVGPQIPGLARIAGGAAVGAFAPPGIGGPGLGMAAGYALSPNVPQGRSRAMRQEAMRPVPGMYAAQAENAKQRYEAAVKQRDDAERAGDTEYRRTPIDRSGFWRWKGKETQDTLARLQNDPAFRAKMNPQDVARLESAARSISRGGTPLLGASPDYIPARQQDGLAAGQAARAAQQAQIASRVPTVAKPIDLNAQKPLLPEVQPGQTTQTLAQRRPPVTPAWAQRSPAGQLLGAANSLVPPQPRAVAPPTQPKPASPPKPVAPAQPQWPTQQVNQPSPGARPASISTPIGGTARFAPEPIPPSPIRDMTRFEAPQAKPFNPTMLMPQLKTPSGIEPDNRGDLLAQSDAAGEEAYADMPSPQAPIRPDEMAGYMPQPQAPYGAEGQPDYGLETRGLAGYSPQGRVGDLALRGMAEEPPQLSETPMSLLRSASGLTRPGFTGDLPNWAAPQQGIQPAQISPPGMGRPRQPDHVPGADAAPPLARTDLENMPMPSYPQLPAQVQQAQISDPSDPFSGYQGSYVSGAANALRVPQTSRGPIDLLQAANRLTPDEEEYTGY